MVMLYIKSNGMKSRVFTNSFAVGCWEWARRRDGRG